MRLTLKNRREDGKFYVIYTYDNGVTLNKIISLEQLIESAKKADKCYGLSIPLEVKPNANND